ncbi:MAG TPA: MFS transporter [Terriglobales bacterium]|nr:MFS transporter [Terriglobales bacterium]
MLTSKDPRLAGRVAFTHSNFVSYTLARFFIVVALEMQSVAVGWQVYEITRRPLDLGYVGLAQFAPGFVLFLFAGHAADLFDRRKLLMWCYGGFALCSALLLAISWRAPQSVHSIYVVLVLLGIFRCFNWPASRALLPQLVPEEHFANAVAWNASTFQIATIAGPAIGGLAYALFRGPEGVYAVAVIVSILSTIFTVRIHPLPASSEKDLAERVAEKEPVSLRTVLAGFRFIWEKKLILGSISLDMFAVLLGGAVALLPVYARTILHTGPWGLGMLRSAPGVGAALTAIVVAHRPIHRRAGLTMLLSVAAFGGFTIVFGISTSLMLSLLALFLIGASDMVSVIIRATLVQVATPDEMRGRVNAVDMLFIGVSNELGEFESGLTAQWFGTVPAVVLGGVGTLLVIASWAWLFPELRQADQLTVAELVPK